MDVAAAIVSFAGILGQCLQGCSFLHAFFADVQSAPQIIRDTAAELHLLIALLETFRNIIADLHASSATVDLTGARAAVALLGEALSRLTRLVVKYASVIAPASGRRVYKTWKALDHAWRRPQLRAHLQRLQHAKVSLLMAQSNILLSQNVVHRVLLTEYEQAMRVAFRQQRSLIRKAMINAFQISSHRPRRFIDAKKSGSSLKPLLPLVEAVPRPRTATSAQKGSSISRRRRVVTIPTWEDELRIKNQIIRASEYASAAQASSDAGSWQSVPSGSATGSTPHQDDAKFLRRRSRRAQRRVRNDTTRSRVWDNVYIGEDDRNWTAFLTVGGVLIFGSGTIILQAVQLAIQVKQTL